VIGVKAQHAGMIQQFGLARRFKREIDRSIALDGSDPQALTDLMEFYLLAPGIAGGDVKRAEATAQTIAGIDYGIMWRKSTAHLGAFAVNIDATMLDRFYQPPSLAVQSLYTARAAGLINVATPLATPGNQLEVLGNPRVKGTFALDWVLDPVRVGASVVYTGKTKDTNFLSTSGVPWPVASMTVVNLYTQYTFAQAFQAHDIHVRVGARNLLNKSPPLESDGYNGALYVPYGRYLYASLGVLL